MAIESKNLLVWVKAMSRGQALPLDSSEIFNTLVEAETYASTSAIAYPGQTIKVLQEDGKYHSYVLQPSDAGYALGEIASSGGTASAIPDEEMLDFLMEMDIVQPLSNANNSVFTDTNNKIYVL